MIRSLRHGALWAGLLAAGSVPAKDFGQFDFDYVGDVETAYVSRGKVVEDRPIQSNLLTAYMALGPFGDVGLWHWNYHSLTPRQRDVADRMFREVDFAACYRNVYEFAKDWRIKGDLQPRWFYFPFLHQDVSDTAFEWWAQLALQNPYLTPSVVLRRGIRPDFTFFQVAFAKPIAFTESFSVTPSVIFDLGNERTFEQRYGKLPSGGDYVYGFQSVQFRLWFDYAFNEYVSVFAAITQFDLISSEARSQTTGLCPKKDFPYATVGIHLHY